jgi:hypothetical protein
VAGDYPDRMTVAACIHLPPEFELLQGDTCITMASDSLRSWLWRLDVRPRVRGPVVVAGEARATSGRITDEITFEFRATIDTIAVDAFGSVTKKIREERTIDGRRYRFGGLAMVPIEQSENATQQDIGARGHHPRPLNLAVTSGPDADQVPWLVVVGSDGVVLSASPLGRSDIDGRMDSSIRAIQFEPAEVDGHPVADWVIVRLPARKMSDRSR